MNSGEKDSPEYGPEKKNAWGHLVKNSVETLWGGIEVNSSYVGFFKKRLHLGKRHLRE